MPRGFPARSYGLLIRSVVSPAAKALPIFEPGAHVSSRTGARSPQRKLEGHGRIARHSPSTRHSRAGQCLAVLLMAVAPSRQSCQKIPMFHIHRAVLDFGGRELTL